jgi:hypothetical protein
VLLDRPVGERARKRDLETDGVALGQKECVEVLLMVLEPELVSVLLDVAVLDRHTVDDAEPVVAAEMVLEPEIAIALEDTVEEAE